MLSLLKGVNNWVLPLYMEKLHHETQSYKLSKLWQLPLWLVDTMNSRTAVCKSFVIGSYLTST